VANTLDAFRGGAVGFIDWLDGGAISPRNLALEVPFSMRDFDLCDVSWIKWDVSMTANLGNDGMMHDRNIGNHATIAESDSNYVVIHAGLGLSEQEFAPMSRQRGHII
jgi:hypothetical protein